MDHRSTSTALRYVRVEERRNERIVNLGHIGIGIVLAVLALSTRAETSRPAFMGLLVAAPFMISFGTMALLMLRTTSRLEWLPYVSVVLEVVLVTGILIAVGTHASFKGAAFLGYFLVIALAGLRFSPVLTLVASMLSVASYVGVFIAFVLNGNATIAPMSQALAGPYVSIALLVQQNAFLAMVGGLLIGVAVRTRRGLASVLSSELADQRDRQSKERPREALVRLVATELASRASRFESSAEDRSEQVAIMACSITNLDELRAAMDRDALVGLLNRFFSDMLDPVLALGGTLHRLSDTGIVLIFGAPASRDADEEMALRAAERTKERLETLRAERWSADEPSLEIGIAVHAGSARVRSRTEVAVDDRAIEYVVGASVRPEAAGAGVLVSEMAFRRLRGVARSEQAVTVVYGGMTGQFHIVRTASGNSAPDASRSTSRSPK